jgi:DMSO/TMAO reductase YedYZ molybdopterin-dependent catalytic subunit
MPGGHNRSVSTVRDAPADAGAWALSGVVAGAAGLATSYGTAMLTAVGSNPVDAVASLVIRLAPANTAQRAVEALGHADKPALVAGILVVLVLLHGWAGHRARRGWAGPLTVYAVVAVIGAVAVLSARGAGAGDLVPLLVGVATWPAALALLTRPLRAATRQADRPEDAAAYPDRSRREFVVRVGALAGGAAVLGVGARAFGAGRRRVEAARARLRLGHVTEPVVPAGAQVAVPSMTPWDTAAGDFYRVDTAILPPTIEPDSWRLRIHGLVDRELELRFSDLLDRRLTETWVTLCCVSNEVGGDLVGNAWWSGVRIADLLAEAGVRPGADAVLQTSDDGWTCGTPLTTLTDGRDAVLAVAMNGRPLPVEHGFPVRTVVPGLYGYVSACKWVVDLEVTRFSDFTAFWTERGWAERGPVKLASRIDVPRSGGSVAADGGRVAGVAWQQHTGIEAVEVALDGGAWQRAELARVPSVDTWAQWTSTLHTTPGQHTLRVRAISRTGEVQTGVPHGPVPNGATGWHTVRFIAT